MRLTTPKSTPAAKNPAIHDALIRARRYFTERAESDANEETRELCDQLRRVVHSLEETASLVAHLKLQVDEVRHGIGMHLEGTGSVPHTRRRAPMSR